MKQVTTSWFFTDVPLIWKMLLIYVRGDMIVLGPFVLIALLIGFFSVKWMLVTLCLYTAFRFLGEMMYWLLQQFGDRKYRPYDCGFQKLDNHSIYILYQTWSLAGLVLSTSAVLYLLFAWK